MHSFSSTSRRSLVKNRLKQTCTRVPSAINWRSNDTMQLIRFSFRSLSSQSLEVNREREIKRTTKRKKRMSLWVRREINAKITRIWSVCNFFLISVTAHVLVLHTCAFTHHNVCIIRTYKWVHWNGESWLGYINWYTSNAQRLLFPAACNQWVNYHYVLRFTVFLSDRWFISVSICKNSSVSLLLLVFTPFY